MQRKELLERSHKIHHVLVTGGAGFVGANLVRLLLDEGYQVRVLDNFSVGRRSYLDGLELEIQEGDILDVEAVQHAVDGVDGIVHLAAQTGVPGSLADPRKDCEVNVIGTLNMLEAARAEQERRGQQLRFVFASSNAPLGKQPPPATEDKAPLPISPYGASKLAGEGYCLAYHGSWNLGTMVLRFANLYGPYSAHKDSVVAKFIKNALQTGVLTIYGDGAQTRDFIHVADLSRAIIAGLTSDVGGETFQIATGVGTSILDLARRVRNVLPDQDLRIDHAEQRAGEIIKNYSSVEKVRHRLGWSPQISLDQGLAETVDWFLTLSRVAGASSNIA